MVRKVSGLRLALFLALCAVAFPVPVEAHKVSAVSVVTELETKEQTFKIELAMDVDPTGDPAIDDVITPEQAARTFATEALKIFFDDQEIEPGEPEIRIISDSDENTPEELRRQKAIATLKGGIPKGTSNFLLYVDELTEAAVVMVVIKDGQPGRRLQVLYPGEFSNPENVEPVIEADPFPEKVGWIEWLGRGFSAILPRGFEYWLFILAYFLLVMRRQPVLWQAAAYTIAHSLALSLAGFRLLNVPSEIVMPIVLASAAYPAIENLFTWQLKPWRLPLIAVLGFFHGLALAGTFWDYEPGISQLLGGILGFNLGVELAQLAFLAIASILVVIASKLPAYRQAIRTPACVIIAGAAIFLAVRQFL